MKRKQIIWKPPFTLLQASCVAAGIILYAVLALADKAGEAGSGAGTLKRAPPGGGDTSYELFVEGLFENNAGKRIQVEIPVRERKYKAEEAEELYDRILPELTKQMLGENESLKSVRNSLNLKNTMEEYGLKIRWESGNPEYMDSFGQIHSGEIPEEGKEIWLKAWITDGEHEQEYDFKLNLYPPLLMPEEKTEEDFKFWANELDRGQQTENTLVLPDDYKGKQLIYSFPKESDYRIIPFLGVFMAVLLYVKEKADKQNQAKRREQQLLFDYSEVVAKLLVFTGAGLTVRGAWERIVFGYEETVKQGKGPVRPAYEEMLRTAGQMSSGMAEGRAYSEFGRRCGLQPYLKLSALLEQNRKNGGRQLRSSLEAEMSSAFEQRKNLAKKLGDEAGTKLLFPLIMMLGVVMVMIVVPAFLSFY